MRTTIKCALAVLTLALTWSCASDKSPPEPLPKVAAPTISPEGPFNFGAPLTVTLASATVGAAIHYTVDGTAPTATSLVYDAPLTLTGTTTVKALATHAGMEASEATSSTFTHRPVDLTLDTGTWGPNGGASIATQLLHLNRFTPAAEDFPFLLRTVKVAFFTQNGGTAVRLVVYADADGDPGNGADLLATVDTTVLNNGAEFIGATWSVYELATPILVTGPGDVLVGYAVLPPVNDFNWPLNEGGQGRSMQGHWDTAVPTPPLLPPARGYYTYPSYNALIRASN